MQNLSFDLVNETINRFISLMPFDIVVLHPPLAQFAVVLPIIAIFFHFLGISHKNDTLLKSANYLFIIGTIFIFLAFLSGRASAPDIKPLLNEDGKLLFHKHLRLGYTIILFYTILMLLKIFSVFVDKRELRIFIGILMIMSVSLVIYQGKMGGELTYRYAAGVDIPSLDDALISPAYVEEEGRVPKKSYSQRQEQEKFIIEDTHIEDEPSVIDDRWR
jgi:uncharacterized membrane protein